VLGGTGKTGSRVAANLTKLGLGVRTAARDGADVRFDWDDPTTHRLAVADVDRVYLVAPILRTDFADQVSSFLDLGQAAGRAPRHLPQRLRLRPGPAPVGRPEGRRARSHEPRRNHAPQSASRLVHAGFQRDIPEARRRRDHGATGDGAEAFVDAEDIAAVAAATLASPDAHAGAEYAPTGPEVLTVSDAADVIADVTGQPAKHNDIDRNAWIDASVGAGVPAAYGEVLRMLTETIASGHGSRPNNDVHNVTGKPPITFAEFARRTAQAWA
jgi:uncharacterized protein YbjT (DUF2867 family)